MSDSNSMSRLSLRWLVFGSSTYLIVRLAVSILAALRSSLICNWRDSRSGFTLLEVMVSLAIMAGVILTLLGSINYHLGIIAAERDSSTLTLLARNRMAEVEQAPAKGEGTFAPAHPELQWQSELLPADLPGLQKLVITVRRGNAGREVTLVKYLPK